MRVRLLKDSRYCKIKHGPPLILRLLQQYSYRVSLTCVHFVPLLYQEQQSFPFVLVLVLVIVDNRHSARFLNPKRSESRAVRVRRDSHPRVNEGESRCSLSPR